ncbi:RHS repeat-associated core domain-containing protein [Chitinophaga sancti]|nr:RHS repeat-associated core domain-containing protein [Chitinophaga sancti]WQD64273.1 RHS repeat-associated core domain-containing protein [Chitinophaga sancti]WQG90103.1 RHS repeat-associated core domain-containing protein [Chitinophaga sancti]
MLSAHAYTGIESYQHQKQGTIKKGDTLVVKDEKFLNSAYDWEKIHNKTVSDIVIFSLYRDSSAIPQKKFKCTIDLKVEYWSSPDQSDPAIDDHIKLEISYDTARGINYQANATYRFRNGYKMKLTVNDITSEELGDQLPAAFRLQGQVIVERSYEADTTHIVPKIVLPSSGKAGTFNAAVLRAATLASAQNGVASISWDKVTYAEEYDLEWTFVDELSANGKILSDEGTGISAAKLAKMFRNNSTRVTLQQEYYDISLVHYMKYLLVRVRTAYMADGIREEGDWDYKMDAGGSTVSAVILLDDNTLHEPKFNWLYSAAYSEDGKKKEVVSYFDGSLRNRQTITLNNSDQKVLIQENLYDEFGRPQVSILPYTINNNILKYYSGQHVTTSGSTYRWSNINGSGSDCINTPDAMGSSSGAGQYYSSSNEFLADASRPESHFIADAGGYPFSVTLYTPDNTNRVSVRGGVGALFQPGPDNTVSKASYLYYSKPAQWELDRMFGNDVGYANHYLKNMTVDGNGQVAVNYQNASGKTIATALAGDAPSNLDALSSKPDPKQETFLLIEPRDFTFDESKLLLSATSSYAAAIIGPVSFTYNAEKLIKIFDENGVKICSNCYYNLHIRVTDDCNKPIYDETIPVGSLTGDCSATGTATGTFSTTFDKIGEYYVTYELGLSSSALDAYTTDYINKNTTLNSKWSYINTALQSKDMKSCFDDCTTCLTSLGTQTAFTTAVKNRLSKDGVELTTTIDAYANNLYTTLYNNCVSLRSNCTTNPCTDLEKTLKEDVSPGGQYALFTAEDTALEKSINVLYLYWRTEFRILTTPTEYNANKFELEDGTVMSANDEACTLSMILHHWKPEWAAQFIKYHPEYCALRFCQANSDNLRWEEKVTNIATISDIPTMLPGAVYSTTSFRWLADKDPAFDNVLNGYRESFIADITNYTTNVLGITQVGTKSLVGYVDYMLYCADNSGNTNANNNPLPNTNNWSTCAPVETCRIADLEWRMYRDKYIELKEKYYAKVRGTSTYCGGLCAVGDTISYATATGTCPQLSAFTIQPGDAACTNLQSLKVTYTGAPLTSTVTLSLYYPSGYDGLTQVSSVQFVAGQTEAAFCIDNGIDRNTVLVRGISCRPDGIDNGGGSTTFDCDAAKALSNFSLSVVRDGLTYDPSTGISNWNCIMTYSGPTIPSGASLIVGVEFSFHENPGAKIYTYTFTGSTRSLTFVLQGVSQATGTIEGSACSNPNPTTPTTPDPVNTGCETALKYKISRINNATYSNAGISTDTLALAAQVTATLTQSVKENCEAQAEVWMTQLDECLQGETDYETSKTKIKAKLIELCKIGGDMNHQSGASTTPSGKSTSEGYTSFKQVLTGLLSTHTINMVCNPWLLDAPYPYYTNMQATSKSIAKSTADICSKLSSLKTDYNTSNGSSSVSFYQWLVNTYGTAMTLTEAEFTRLQNSCSNCRYLLANDMTLPVFLDPSSTGAITPIEYQEVKTQMTNEIGGWLNAEHANYEHVFATYMNHQLGFTLSYSDYKDYEDKLAANPSSFTMLCNAPVFSTVTVNPYSCTEELLDDAVSTGTVIYNDYISAEKKKFRKEYIAYCSGVKPNLQLTTNEQLYHFTLYYYDQAGNLVRTVPPEGVHLLDAGLQTQIDGARDNLGGNCTFDGPVSNSQKESALTALTAALSSTSARSLELWLYNGSSSGSQFLATSSGQQYLINACVSGRYLHLDIYTLSSTTSEVIITASVHTIADMQGALPLKPWTHVVFQGALLNANSLSVYVNGKLCPVTTTDQASGDCGWELAPGSYPENFANVKQLRIYDRLLSGAEIAANAAEPCMSYASLYRTALEGSKVYRGRFNVPSAGSETTTSAGSLSETQYTPIYPAHGLTTSYAYQSLGGVRIQKSPDGGLGRFWYDNLGRIIASQNAEQALTGKYSYTVYDGQSRTKEVGLKTGGNTPGAVSFIAATAVSTFQNSGSNSQIVQTYYDEPYAGFTNTQENLRKRISAITYKDAATDNPQQITYYSYDQLGNIKTLWQQLKDLDLKQIDYKYDLVSGKVNTVRYQYGDDKTDKFYYGYVYDADNRLIKSLSGINSVSSDGWEIENARTDAFYRYYLHGPLARMELGHDQLVQGVDYAYTIQGWLKQVNSQYLSPSSDMGGDGLASTDRSVVAPDVFGYSLDYFEGDYKPLDITKTPPLSWTKGAAGEVGTSLYNGNVSHSTVGLSQFNNVVGYSYRYDQLNRLKAMRQHSLINNTATWNAGTAGEKYKEDYTYDGNGNILSLLRNGSGINGQSVLMDILTYGYNKDAAGNLLDNKLLQVTDAVSNSGYTVDMTSQANNNYIYDKIGNVIKDVVGGISNIEWNVYGKIKEITKTDGSKISFKYDANGHRVYKQYTHNDITEKAWYIRDALGNTLAVYEKVNDGPVYWKEQALYGNSRIGIWNGNVSMSGTEANTNWDAAGNKRYELSNQLGNVLVTIGDQLSSDNQAVIYSAQDYYSFGMLQPDRQFAINEYRYGYNGKENDNQVKGNGNQIDFGARVYDSRIGRWMSVDPLASKYPEIAPHVFTLNNPIFFRDPDGREVIPGKDFLASPWANIYKKMSDNTQFQKMIKNYKGSKTINLNLGVDETKIINNATAYTTVTDRRPSAANLKLMGTASGEINYSLSKLSSKAERNDGAETTIYTRSFTEIGRAQIMIHEAIHAMIGTTIGEKDDNNHNAVASHRQMLVDGLKEYNTKYKLGYSDEDLEVLSWQGLEASDGYKNLIQGFADKNKTTVKEEGEKFKDKMFKLSWKEEGTEVKKNETPATTN